MSAGACPGFTALIGMWAHAPNAHEPSHWKGRTVDRDDALLVLQWAFALLPPDARRSFLDVGCGPGTMIQHVLDEKWADKTVGGIDFNPDDVKLALRVTPNIIEANLLELRPGNARLKRLTSTPTVAYFYDGGIFPQKVIVAAVKLLTTVLPRGSIVVFLTAIERGAYSAAELRDLVQRRSGDRFRLVHVVGPVFEVGGQWTAQDEADAREVGITLTPREGTMQALYFADATPIDDDLSTEILSVAEYGR